MDIEEADRRSIIDFVEQKLNIKEENPLIQAKKIIDKGYTSTSKKSLLRFVYIIVDTTQSSTRVDFKPSRIGLTQIYLKNFIKNFFDSNPLSVLSIGKTQNGQCITLQEFTSSISLLEKTIEKLVVDEKEDFSLFECLNETFNIFAEAPPYAFREVVLIQSTPSTKDKGDINEQISKAKQCKITFNIISLNAKTFIFQKLTKETQGKYDTALHEKDYENLLNSYCEPPQQILNKTEKTLIQVGFPDKNYSKISVLCACHMEFKTNFYICPQCRSKNCEVPSKCSGCQLNLILPLHITKSYHFSQNLKEFELQFQVKQNNIMETEQDKTQNILCNGCSEDIKEDCFSKCQNCKSIFCLECDILIHKQKLNCPKC
ncbi:hypothetical protein ABPG72_001410 [Tetrahymena utriculariae]